MKKVVLDPIILYSIDELEDHVKQSLINEEVYGYLYDEGVEISEDEALDKLRELGSRYFSDGDSVLVMDGCVFMEARKLPVSSVCEQ